MFDFFRKKGAPDKSPSGGAPAAGKVQRDSQIEAAKWAALKSAIDAQKETDPLAGLKIGAKEINQRLINGLKNEKGVHIESFLTVIGALAGILLSNERPRGAKKGYSLGKARLGNCQRS